MTADQRAITNKKFFFLSGLPRSGSTLLGAFLSQNPNVYGSSTSAISALMTSTHNGWHKQSEMIALGKDLSDIRRINCLRGMLEGFYADVSRPIIIDKDRSWPFKLELAEAVLGYKPKVIACVRDIRDVLASLEGLWRKSKSIGKMVPQEEQNPIDFLTIDGRCDVLMRSTELVGGPIALIVDAVTRGWKDQIMFVEYEDFCDKPILVAEEICKFLEIDFFDGHNPNSVASLVKENDDPYGWGPLHEIRSVIQPRHSNWTEYLPNRVAAKYTEISTFWRRLETRQYRQA